MERVALPVGLHPRWRTPALALLGALLLAGALVLGGGGTLFVWGLAGLARWPLRVVALAGLYCLPGLALLRLLWPRARVLAGAARLALAMALSVALPPLLLLLFSLLGLPWDSVATWAYLLLSLVVWLGLEIRDRRLLSQSPISNLQSLISNLDAPSFALLGISLAALLVRLYTVRDLPTGLLGDSYHHTLMAQLLVDNRGLFHSWQPYAPLTTFTYHFGFHANVAFVHYVTGIDVVQSLVWTGQILNAIIVPMIFALALALGGSRWAGVWAALLAGFVSNLPAFFVNWGRYTQLTGQIVLMAVVVCWINLVDQRLEIGDWRLKGKSLTSNLQSRIPWRLLILTALVTAAMILTHYLVTALAAAFVGSYLLALVLARRSWRAARDIVLLAVPAVLLALLLVTPWLLNIVGGFLLRNATGLVSANAQQTLVIAQLSVLEPIVPKYVDGKVMLGALAGLLLALWRRDWRMALPALWCALLVIAVVPQIVGLPGTGVIDNITGLGTLYIPTVLLAGSALAAAQAYCAAQLDRLHVHKRTGVALVGALLLLLIAGNTGWQSRVANSETALVVDADMAAMQWIRENTAPDARFVINTFPAYGGTLAAGSDAGWWLPLLAHRATILPPLTYGSEQGEQPTYGYGVNLLIGKLRGKPLTDLKPLQVDLARSVALRTLAANKIDYIYSGANPYPGPKAVDRIDTAKLRASPYFKLVYERDGVEIFQFLKNAK